MKNQTTGQYWLSNARRVVDGSGVHSTKYLFTSLDKNNALIIIVGYSHFFFIRHINYLIKVYYW